MNTTRTLRELISQLQTIHTPRLVISDLDGTLFTPDARIIYEMLRHNRQIRSLLQEKHIPLIVNTARYDWARKEKHDARILSIHPDTVIAGAGTVIYHKTIHGGWTLDAEWETRLSKTWNYEAVTISVDKIVKTWQSSQKFRLKRTRGNQFLLRYKVRNTSAGNLPVIAASLQKEVGKEIKIIYTEALYSNRLGFPTGYILIVPASAGKDRAAAYLLNTYANILNTSIEAFCFGDGAIDLNSFLTMPSTEQYHLTQFLVHPTKLAKHLYETVSFSHKPQYMAQRGLETIENNIL